MVTTKNEMPCVGHEPGLGRGNSHQITLSFLERILKSRKNSWAVSWTGASQRSSLNRILQMKKLEAERCPTGLQDPTAGATRTSPAPPPNTPLLHKGVLHPQSPLGSPSCWLERLKKWPNAKGRLERGAAVVMGQGGESKSPWGSERVAPAHV